MTAPWVTRFCSATPISTTRFGRSLLNKLIWVESVRSAQTAAVFSWRLPASNSPRPKPLRIGSLAISLLKISSTKCKLLMFGPDFAAKGTEFVESLYGLLVVRWHAVPMEIVFHKVHALARDGVRND